ncbi:RNA polymerase sigma factor [Agromyces laixinhei]|uniref:RNA polymerase sigma factor n=1 Tax=Agromyces laixinhei TaxID=2585717 RepID=UPI001E585355|nr:RNA polymerase sigma factor [Agromyces laixinhei]
MPRQADVGSPLQVVADEILVERAIDGDDAAFETLMRRYAPLMRAHARRVLRNAADADDVVQDAFVNAWRQLENLRDRAMVKSWLMKITSRCALALLRRQPATLPLPVVEPAVPDSMQPENVGIRTAQLRALSLALDRLPEDQRNCWLLREVAELSYVEVAKEMNLTPASVRGKLARARVSLATQMEGWR